VKGERGLSLDFVLY